MISFVRSSPGETIFRYSHCPPRTCSFLPQAKESPVELEPPVTTAIALHHFTAWAKYEEVRILVRYILEACCSRLRKKLRDEIHLAVYLAAPRRLIAVNFPRRESLKLATLVLDHRNANMLLDVELHDTVYRSEL